jgi:hypothetical protein
MIESILLTDAKLSILVRPPTPNLTIGRERAGVIDADLDLNGIRELRDRVAVLPRRTPELTVIVAPLANHFTARRDHASVLVVE